VIGIVLLLVSCLGIFVAGLFPWINVHGVPTETPPHVVGAILTFSGASIGLSVLSRRMRADPRWHGLSAYVFGTGIVMLILFVVVGFFAINAGTPFHRWAGLLQRVLVVVWVTCQLVIARRLLRIGRDEPVDAASAP
jgi:Kef-type K+ transport system membrane component KefB